jgi:hypothetical protein
MRASQRRQNVTLSLPAADPGDELVPEVTGAPAELLKLPAAFELSARLLV